MPRQCRNVEGEGWREWPVRTWRGSFSRSLKSKSNKGEFLVSGCGCLAAKNTKGAKVGGELYLWSGGLKFLSTTMTTYYN